MPLSPNEQYAVSAACFVGGMLSCVTHLWLIFDFLPMIKFAKGMRVLHYQLAIANLCTVAFFFFGAVSHFEQAWIFGQRACTFYVFWCKFTPISAMSVLAVTVRGEYHSAVPSKTGESGGSSAGVSALAWSYGLLWGVLALTHSQYGQEPAGFTCTVIWYKVQPYVTYMSIFGFGIPTMIAIYYAYMMYSKGMLADNPQAKIVSTLVITMTVQFGAYATGYLVVCSGISLSLYAIAFAQVWTKSLGVVHPFVYSRMLASSTLDTGVKED